VAEATVQLTREEQRAWLAGFLQQYQQARLEDRQAWAGALRVFEERHEGEINRLRDGLASLASSTGDGFEQTQTQMRLLAGGFTGGDFKANEPQTENP
jgi:hypothetical protein